MPINHEVLRNFLLKLCPLGIAANLMTDLEPFFFKAKQGKYDLAPDSEKLWIETLSALHKVFGTDKVTRVIPVSLSSPISKPDWMAENAYQEALRKSIGVSLWASVKNSLGFALATRFGDRPWPERKNIIARIITESFGETFLEILGPPMGSSIVASLVYYLDFAITDKIGEAMSIRPLILLLPKTIPLGEKTDEPGAWLTQVA
jgi:hypothetical protein